MKKTIAIVLATSFLFQIFFPTIALALTSGPTQPEVQSFTSINANDMVDLFTGDFSYNIPLVDVGGYPINLGYQAGITMDQEASWVGLGWNINPGVINRTMRGLPDDFTGDPVKHEFHIRKNWTAAVSIHGDAEIAGYPIAGAKLGVFYNNYRGPGLVLGGHTKLKALEAFKKNIWVFDGLGIDQFQFSSVNASANAGIEINTQTGLDLSFDASIKRITNFNKETWGMNAQTSMNSRSGFKSLTISPSYQPVKDFINSQKYLRQAYNTLSPSIGLTRGLDMTSFTGFTYPTYIPTISDPMKSLSFDFSLKLVGAFWFFDPGAEVTGTYSEQNVSDDHETMDGYGYATESLPAYDNKFALMDMNREKDVPFSKYTPHLPIPSFTNDLYSVSASGIGGQFRAERGDKGILFDHQSQCTNKSLSGGIDLGGGNIFKNGINLAYTSVNSITDRWEGGNAFAARSNFDESHNDKGYEPVYFKMTGEKSARDLADNEYNRIGGDNPVAVNIEAETASPSMRTTDRFGNDIGTLSLGSGPAALGKNERTKRKTGISVLTAKEASVHGLDKKINSYDEIPGQPSLCGPVTQLSRINDKNTNAHHHSEFTVTNADGRRYVYGIPTYNNYQKEATFNLDHANANDDGLIDYVSGDDDTKTNHKGRDHYYSADILPPYAYSYLLTGVLSPDYIDRTGDGITDDDHGSAFKFNYTRITNDYKWRVPIQANEATFHEGFMARVNDQTGSYLYGEKEIWYLHSVESPEYIAFFRLNDAYPREDGLGVLGISGGKDDSRKLRYLDRIELFSKSELKAAEANSRPPVPIKTVHFRYTNALCPGIPNSSTFDPHSTDPNDNQGKLTLTELWFTYGSNTGRMNSYYFGYSDTDPDHPINPSYNLTNYDRWGSYQDNTQSTTAYPANRYFPYVIQDQAMADKNAKAWNLILIGLPSGAVMHIKYEADRYENVQNKRAMQMCEIVGTGATKIYADRYHDPANLYDNGPCNYLFVKLPQPYTSVTDFKEKYLKGNDYFFFKCLVQLDPKSENLGREYVPGYLKINECYETPDPSIICLDVNKRNANPIARAGWQFLRLNLPELYSPGFNPDDNVTFKDILLGLASLISGVVQLAATPDSYCKLLNYAKYMETTGFRSFIRLNCPGEKLGGGSRVAEIRIDDKWNNMSSHEATSEYGQTYTYEGGVASYEPALGNEENPFRTPIPYTEEISLGPNNELYLENPLGESYFPAPIVGYSKVTVKSIYAGTAQSKPGKMVSRFYTAKDFPVVTGFTNPVLKPVNGILSQILHFNATESATVSEGFSVEVNDMHGKLLSEENQDEQGFVVDGAYYTYLTDDPAAETQHLKNKVRVILPTGLIKDDVSLGESVDLVTDMRYHNVTSNTLATNLNFEGSLFSFWPIIILPLLSPFTRSTSTFKSASTMKFIQRFGILESVRKTQKGTSTTSRNLAYDSETGDPILTSVTNEFDDPIYSVGYPAHWPYEGMRPSYQNVGAIARNVSVTDGQFYDMDNYFFPGDEVEVISSTGEILKEKLWAVSIHGSTTLMYKDGTLFNTSACGPVTLKVIRSGQKNMTSACVQSISSLGYPSEHLVYGPPYNYPAGEYIHADQSTNILNASATEYSQNWKIQNAKPSKLNCGDPVSGEPECNQCQQALLKEFIVAVVRYFYDVPKSSNVKLDEVIARMAKPTECTGAIQHFLGLDISAFHSTPYYTTTPLLGYDHSAFSHFEAHIGDHCKLILDYLPGGAPGQVVSFKFLDPNQITVWPEAISGCNASHVCGNTYRIPPYTYAYFNCETCTAGCYDETALAQGAVFNPYYEGVLGCWYPLKEWAYHSQRLPQPDPLMTQSMRTDGTYMDFLNFLETPYVLSIWNVNQNLPNSNWVEANSITRRSYAGEELENKDALGNYSAAVYGYKNLLPVAVAKNARYRQIGFDGFEDYMTEEPDAVYSNSCNQQCPYKHFEIGTVANVSDEYAHTGNFSLKTKEAFIDLTVPPTDPAEENYAESGVHQLPQYAMQNGIMESFLPHAGEEYIVSAWVKVDPCEFYVYGPSLRDYIQVYLNGTASPTYTFFASGPVIEGWQKIEDHFSIPSSSTNISLRIKLASTNSGDTYFDDFRIFPKDANMKSFVYDAKTGRLMADLDENNYAKFYEYNDKGELVRTKRETERGIMTLSENRAYIRGAIH